MDTFLSDEFLQACVAVSIGFIASPLVEILKSRLSERGSERTIKRDLVATLRVVVGFFDAFEEQLNSAIGPAIRQRITMDALQARSWEALQSFDLQPVHGLIEQITRLDIRQSSSSGAGQVLTKKMLIALYGLEQIKSITPVQLRTGGLPREENPNLQQFALREGDEALVGQARESLTNLRQFIVGPYAEILSMDQLSLVIDPKIKAFEDGVREWRIKQADADLKQSRERFSDYQEKNGRPD